MKRLYLEIKAAGNVPSEVFVKLVGVPAKRCNLVGSLRVLNSDCSEVSVTAEGEEEDVDDYYNYMRLGDQLVGTVTKVEEDNIANCSESGPFSVVNYGDEDDEDHETTGDEASQSYEEARHCPRRQGEDRDEEPRSKRVGYPGVGSEQDIRVIPETPEKDETSLSESEPEEAQYSSPAKEESQTMLMELPKSPVFKGGRPQTRREPVGAQETADMFEEESQSILLSERKRRRM